MFQPLHMRTHISFSVSSQMLRVHDTREREVGRQLGSRSVRAKGCGHQGSSHCSIRFSTEAGCWSSVGVRLQP